MLDDEDSGKELPPLVHAVCNDDLQQVRILIKRVHDRYTRHWALLKAIKGRNTSIVKFLLDQRIYHKKVQKLWSYNCLMRYAYESEDISVVKLLLASGADPYNGAFHITSTGRTKDPTDVQMEVLLNDEMRFQLPTDSKACYLGWFAVPEKRPIERSLMCDAIRKGDTETIRLLLEFDNCKTRSNNMRYLALFAAYTIGDEAKVEALVKWCLAADRHFIDKQLETVILDGEIEHVKMLLDYVTNINASMAKTERQETPLLLAVRVERTDICDLLLKNGADINLMSERFQNYSHSLPLPSGCPYYPPALSRLTRPLLVALGSFSDRYTKSNMVSYLLSLGADPNLPDGEGKMPLHYAVHHGAHNETIKMLLQYGADVNPQDKSIGHSLLSRLLEYEYHHGRNHNMYNDKYYERACMFIWAGTDVGVYYSWSRVTMDTARGKWRKFLSLRRKGTEWVPSYRIEWWTTRFDDCVLKCILSHLDARTATCTSKLNLVTTLVMSGSLTRSDVSKLYEQIRAKDDWTSTEWHEDVVGFISEFLARGYTLQELCRLKLRQSIQPPLWVKVMSEHIKLPKPLKAYLLDEQVPAEQSEPGLSRTDT
ncbi:poly [ADP-ribose] polymerase tankyrase-2-like [Lineus longissimus]|uniref:poly [ADP-ribose] polymerase tankyrase-2-like n=1 Tax=Lineus longissimus TaxID=88925 RepID=UPI002B4C81DA